MSTLIEHSNYSVDKHIYTRKLLFLLVFSVAILLANTVGIYACSCLRSKPPCGNVDKSSVIFTGEVVHISPVQEYRKKVQFKVIEPFNNVKKQTLIVETGSGGGDCGYSFEIGEKYLVYASEYGGRIGTGLCSRTQILSKAQNDLEILRQIKSNRSIQPQIFGKLNLIQTNPYRETPLNGAKIAAIDEIGKTHETVSDEFGNYRFVNLPVGKYKIKAIYKESFIKIAEAVTKSAQGEQCAEESFYFREGGSIKGRVLDNENKPVTRLRIYAERIDFSSAEAKSAKYYEGWTDENGNYEIEGLQNGNYILGINYMSAISIDFPFPPTYYPNTSTADKAENINVSTEKALTEFNFKLPQKLKIRTLTGTAFFTNGKPVAEGKVKVEEDKSGSIIDSADIDKEGRFTLKVVEGQSYYLYVYKTWNIHRESKKIYIPKTGEIEPLKIVIHPLL